MKRLHLDHLSLIVAVAFAVLTSMALVGEALQISALDVPSLHDRLDDLA